MNKEWSEKEIQDFYIALLHEALGSIPDSGAVMVLGPMFIIRAVDENFEIMRKKQFELRLLGKYVFDQIPFTDHVLEDAPFAYDKKFELFYKKLIASGKITAVYLLPDWRQSLGTVSEVAFCKEFGVPIFE